MKNSRAKSMRLAKGLFIFMTAAIMISSCSEEETLSMLNSETSSDETTLESTSDEIDDLASAALDSGQPASGGRIRSVQDNRFDCQGTTVIFTNVSDDKTSGTVTISFGPDGCTDPRGNVRKGTIVVSWTGGRWFRAGSTQTISLQNYSINGIAISGTRTRTCTSASGNLTAFSVQWNVSATHSFTFEDQSTATRTVNKTVKWDHTSSENTHTITTGPNGASAASGVNRLGKEYSMNIESPLVILASCVQASKVFLPVSGIKILTRAEDQKTLEFDFGSGECDNTFTLTVDGVTKMITAKNEHKGG